jgi:TolB-like protein
LKQDIRGFIEELKRRRVFRVALGYTVAAFAVLQGADVLADALERPDRTMKFVAFLAIIGFPVAIVLAWVFDITTKGVVRTSPSVDTSSTGRPVRFAAVAVLLLVTLVGGAWWLARGAPGQGATADGAVAPGAAADRAGAPAAPSIAVLPFVNMSADPDNEYFSDGISEELLNLLAQVPRLQVAARTSSFAFRNRDEDAIQIGRQLRVGHILEGSVRKDGSRVRITAQLIEAGQGFHVWSDAYDRDLVDVFAVQDEIARAIVNALEPHLGIAPDAHTARATVTRDPRVHDLYLLGLRDWHRRENALRSALERFREAARLDTAYAPAHAGMALTYAVLPMYGDFPVDEAIRLGKAAAQRALALTPDMPEAYAALGQIAQNYEWDWTAAEQSYDRALELNPNYATAHMWRCELFSSLGRSADALRACRRGLALDPLAPVAYNQHGAAFMFAGQHDSARASLMRAIELDTTYVTASDNLLFAHLLARDFDSWLSRSQRGAETAAERRLNDALHAGWSRPDDARARADALAGIESLRRETGDAGLHIVLLSLKLLGEDDRALAVLEEALDVPRQRPFLPLIVNSGLFDDVANDSRYRAARSRMNLDQDR